MSNPTGLYVSGNYAYLTNEKSGNLSECGLEIVDISDPSHPVHKGSISHGDGGALLLEPRNIFISGNYAYVVSPGDYHTSSGTGAFEIIDISDPAHPVHKSSIQNGEGGASLCFPQQVEVFGDYAYVISYNDGWGTLEILDISDPTHPVHKGRAIRGVEGAILKNTVFSFHISEDNAFVLSAPYGDYGFEIFDVSNKSHPVHSSNYTYLVDGALIENPIYMSVTGTNAYVLMAEGSVSFPNTVEIVDLTNPIQPLHKGNITDGEGGAFLKYPRHLFVSGNYLYVVTMGYPGKWQSGLEIIDLGGDIGPTPTETPSTIHSDFKAEPLEGLTPLSVQFTDTSSSSPTSWSWDFGDGGQSIEKSPLHVYTTAGTYDVSLTSTNTEGSDIKVKTDYIIVTEQTPTQFTFSITNSKWDDKHSDWDQNAIKDSQKMEQLFINLGWKQAFPYKQGDEVTKGIFGVNPTSGEHTLNEATLHYHNGHGGLYVNDKTQSFIWLLNPDQSGYAFDAPEITQKWGGENKWVILSSCSVLRDGRWKNAMGTTHGILGFNTTTYAHPEFMATFVEYAKTESVLQSYFDTTDELFGTTWVDTAEGKLKGERLTAKVYFRNSDQAENDYLPGMVSGKGIRPEAPPTDLIREYQWPPQNEVTAV